jgi:hypothetical protein
MQCRVLTLLDTKLTLTFGSIPVYLDYGTSDTVTLNLLLSQNANRDREWNIQIQMIPCRSELRGEVKSVAEIESTHDSLTHESGTQYMRNLLTSQESFTRFITETTLSTFTHESSTSHLRVGLLTPALLTHESELIRFCSH